ncbi:MAG: plasmid mobilization relaxosome protein MobC [Lachnospiraceae bacterium]|nr:plasmid mobilization relaxosome protein MobC [Lachnospiraceae bacterium]
MRKRTHQIKIWMNDEEYALLLDKMQRSGQTRQNVMISALKEATITTEEEISELKRSNSLMADLLKQLRGMPTNINQVAHMANATGQIASINELSKMTNQISNLRREGEVIWQLIRQSISQRKHMQP